MSSVDREELKEQLRAMVAERGDGIDLDTPFQWVIEDLKQPIAFFDHLPALLPSGSILYVEGTSISPELAADFVTCFIFDTSAVLWHALSMSTLQTRRADPALQSTPGSRPRVHSGPFAQRARLSHSLASTTYV